MLRPLDSRQGTRPAVVIKEFVAETGDLAHHPVSRFESAGWSVGCVVSATASIWAASVASCAADHAALRRLTVDVQSFNPSDVGLGDGVRGTLR
eukprot:scaffold251916_cov41-Tisochrysis_lutea.AAC.1